MFGKLCADCPLCAKCTTAKTDRSMTIHQFDALLRAACEQAPTQERSRSQPGSA